MESVSNGLSHNQARCRLLAWQDIENARKKACSPGVALGLLHAVELFEERFVIWRLVKSCSIWPLFDVCRRSVRALRKSAPQRANLEHPTPPRYK